MKYSALEGWSFYKMKNYPEKALINIICAVAASPRDCHADIAILR